jgi:hypothetical protein
MSGCSCCGGCCCIDGEKDPSKTTQADCEAASGTWSVGVSCSDPCFCCTYGRLCLEKVESRVGPFAGPRPPGWFDYDWADDIPAEQPAGTIRVFTETFGATVPSRGCAGTSPGKQNILDSPCFDADPCGDGSFYFLQWYYRQRAVDSCADCNDIEPDDPQTPVVTEEELQFPDGYLNCCTEDGLPPVDVEDCEDCRPGGCNDFGTGCVINRVTAMGCFALDSTSCDVRDQASPTPPTFSDCLEATGVSLCENPLP